MDIVKYLYEADPETSLDDRESHSSSLAAAIESGSLEVFEFVYKAQQPSLSNHWPLDIYGCSLFAVAAYFGHIHIMKELLKRDAECYLHTGKAVYYQPSISDGKARWTPGLDNIQRTAGHTPLMAAAANGQVEAFSFIYNLHAGNPEMLEATDDLKRDVFYWACYGGNIPMIKHLLAINPKYIDRKGLTFRCYLEEHNTILSPLQLAFVGHGDDESIEYLISVGARVNYDAKHVNIGHGVTFNGVTFNGITFGFDERGLAVFSGKMLKQGVNMELIYQFFACVEKGDIKKVQEFIKSGFPIHARDSQNRNLLMLAIQNDHVDVALLLLENGAKNTPSDNGDTAFMLALARGHEEVVVKGCSIQDALKSGKTIYDKESKFSHEEQMTLVQENSAIEREVAHAEARNIKLDYEYLANHVNPKYWISFANRWYKEDVSESVLLANKISKAEFERIKKKKSRLATLISQGMIKCRKTDNGECSFELSFEPLNLELDGKKASSNSSLGLNSLDSKHTAELRSLSCDDEQENLQLETVLKLSLHAEDYKQFMITFFKLIDRPDLLKPILDHKQDILKDLTLFEGLCLISKLISHPEDLKTYLDALCKKASHISIQHSSEPSSTSDHLSLMPTPDYRYGNAQMNGTQSALSSSSSSSSSRPMEVDSGDLDKGDKKGNAEKSFQQSSYETNSDHLAFAKEWENSVIVCEDLLEKSMTSEKFSTYKANKETLSHLVFTGTLKHACDSAGNSIWQIRSGEELINFHKSETEIEKLNRYEMAMKFAIEARSWREVMVTFLPLINQAVLGHVLSLRENKLEDMILALGAIIRNKNDVKQDNPAKQQVIPMDLTANNITSANGDSAAQMSALILSNNLSKGTKRTLDESNEQSSDTDLLQRKRLRTT